MKEDINLDNLKKDMPYKVPEDFFAGITEKTLKEAKKRERSLHFSRWRTISISIAASLLLFFCIRMFTISEKSTNNNYIAFDDTVQQLYSDYSNEIIESAYYVETENTTNTYNEIDQILSEIPDEELDDIFSNTNSDNLYAKL